MLVHVRTMWLGMVCMCACKCTYVCVFVSRVGLYLPCPTVICCLYNLLIPKLCCGHRACSPAGIVLAIIISALSFLHSFYLTYVASPHLFRAA